jgi:trimeric autotransporter adhesin
VRAPGGIWLGTTNTPSTPTNRFINTSIGAYLSSGGVWTNGSDRNTKENFTAVNAQSILAQVAALPISTWNYRAEDATVRHIGPMAQDFYAAFGLGANDISIGTVDADGVALAAIQGLHQLSQAQEAEIMAQKAELAALTERLAALEAQARQNAGLPLSMSGWFALLGLSGVALGVVWQSRRAGGR